MTDKIPPETTGFPGIFTTHGSLYHVFYEALHKHLAAGGPSPVSREDTLLQFAVVEALFRSAREGRTVALGTGTA